MPAKRRQTSRSSRRTLALAVLLGLTALLAVAAVVTWTGRGGPPEAALPPSGAPIPSVDPHIVATEVVGLAPELTLVSAEMLARAMPGATGAPLSEMGLLFASRGFDSMERTDLLELGTLFDEMVATLPPGDGEWMRDYMRKLREGGLGAEDSVRGRRLLTQGVSLQPPEHRARLQALMEKAIAAAVEARRRDAGRTPPSPPANVNWPAAAFQPPNSPAADPAGVAPSGSPSPATRDEAYWRARMKDAREKAAALTKQVDELERITRQNLGATSKRAAELAKAREDLAVAERAIADIEEEGRRAGALPGWFRE
jgi:hypothetical protein